MNFILLLLINLCGLNGYPSGNIGVGNFSSPCTNQTDATESFCSDKKIGKRYIDPTFRGYPKTKEEIWERNFAAIVVKSEQTLSLVALLNKITTTYLSACIPIILYDSFVLESENLLLDKLFESFPMTYIHGLINEGNTVNSELLKPKDGQCRNYILFLRDILLTQKIIGPQTTNRVVVISRSTQWKLQEFLSSTVSRNLINLLVIGESFSIDQVKERPYVLYTHQLYTDGLGASRPSVLTSWIKGRLSRPHMDLFPTKFTKGFAGHRFIVAASNQQPFVFRRQSEKTAVVDIQWDGIEYRLLKIFSRMLNFTIEIVEPRDLSLGSGDAVIEEIRSNRADIGIGGIYVTSQRFDVSDISAAHSTDCAAFITLTSKALPRYRAIMGPFQWPVWVALTAAYLIAILPLAFSDKMTLRHLIGNCGEVENMFWYVFGTFTNSLTFSGENSWSNTKKTSTRMLIGWYWMFTIIITACYTGSIIAFVTFPVFPETIDSIEQLLWGFYRIGTLDRGGWERWFVNSTHSKSKRLLKNLEFVSNVEEGLSNVTKAFFWSYAFLGSRAQLEYIVSTNFSSDEISKRSALHISDECFSFFGVSLAFPPNSVYKERFNDAILRFQSSGLMEKVISDVSQTMQKSSNQLLRTSKASGNKLTQEERSLNLADTEGMFLLLGIGFLIAGGVLLSEWVGGCTNRCREIMKRRKREKAEHEQEVLDAERNDNLDADYPENPTKSQCPSSVMSVEVESEVSRGNTALRKRSNTSSSILTANLSRETLRELYNGPQRRHSSIIVIEGKMIFESEATQHAKKSKEENVLMKKLAYLNIEKARSAASNVQFHQVQINRPPTPFATVRTAFEERFGEEIVHSEDDDFLI